MVRLALFVLAAGLLSAACGSSAGDDRGDGSVAAEPSGTIAYTCGEPPGICVIEADGSGRGRLTGRAVVDQAPDWEPDGGALITARLVGHNVQLYRIDLRSGAEERLTPPRLQATYGRVSPDGARLAFVCVGEAGSLDVCVSNADGSGVEVPVPTPVDEFDPDWSPDGARIAFARYFETSAPAIFVLDAGGREEGPLAEGLTPAWSPDGRTIVVSGGGLRLVDVETGDERQLTEGQFDTEPSWSPDGRWVVFRRGEVPDAALYLVAVDGSRERRLTPAGETATLPSWGPSR